MLNVSDTHRMLGFSACKFFLLLVVTTADEVHTQVLYFELAVFVTQMQTQHTQMSTDSTVNNMEAPNVATVSRQFML